MSPADYMKETDYYTHLDKGDRRETGRDSLIVRNPLP
jgi:hypothetical protein